jgi:hypothetical protein
MGAMGEVSGKDAGAPSNLEAEAAALCSKHRRQLSATVGKVPVVRIRRALNRFRATDPRPSR